MMNYEYLHVLAGYGYLGHDRKSDGMIKANRH